jgi:hypothetical protein
VFADGTLTIVIGPEPWPEAIQVYVGPHKLRHVKTIWAQAGCACGTGGTVSLPARSGREETDLATEQESRLLSGIKWLQILRE